MPGAIYQPIPTIKGIIREENLTSFLPGVQATFAQTNLMAAIGTKQDPKAFTDFGVNSFQDPQAISVLKGLQYRLQGLETLIEQAQSTPNGMLPCFSTLPYG